MAYSFIVYLGDGQFPTRAYGVHYGAANTHANDYFPLFGVTIYGTVMRRPSSVRRSDSESHSESKSETM